MDEATFQSILTDIERSTGPMSRVPTFQRVAFRDLDDRQRCEIARALIVEQCPTVGAYTTNGDAGRFLAEAGDDLARWPAGRAPASRRLPRIAHACQAVTAFPAGVFSMEGSISTFATTYLIVQIEYLLRLMSPLLNDDGRPMDAAAGAQIREILGSKRRRIERVNQVGQAFTIATHSTATVGVVPAVDVLARLDAGLQARSQSNRGGLGLDVATRLDYIRHPVAHGTMPDPFGDGLFYGLLASICIYGTPFFERPT